MVDGRGVKVFDKEAQWRPLFGGTQGGQSLNKEVEWRPLFGGTQGGGEVEIKK